MANGMGSWKNTSLHSDVLFRPKVKENLKYFSKNFNLENTKKIYMFRDLTTGKVGLRTPRQQKQNILTFFLEACFWWWTKGRDLIQNLEFSGCFLPSEDGNWTLGWPDTVEQSSRNKRIFRKNIPRNQCRVP